MRVKIMNNEARKILLRKRMRGRKRCFALYKELEHASKPGDDVVRSFPKDLDGDQRLVPERATNPKT